MEKPSNVLGDLIAWITLLDAWGLIGIAIILTALAVMFWKLNSGATPFRVGDALIDPMTGKASILRIGFLVGLCGSWSVILYQMIRGADVTGLTLGVLGIFVTPVITNRAFEIWDPRTKAAAFNTAPGMPAPTAAEVPATAGDVTATVNIKP